MRWHCNDVIGNLHVTIWYVWCCESRWPFFETQYIVCRVSKVYIEALCELIYVLFTYLLMLRRCVMTCSWWSHYVVWWRSAGMLSRLHDWRCFEWKSHSVNCCTTQLMINSSRAVQRTFWPRQHSYSTGSTYLTVCLNIQSIESVLLTTLVLLLLLITVMMMMTMMSFKWSSSPTVLHGVWWLVICSQWRQLVPFRNTHIYCS